MGEAVSAESTASEANLLHSEWGGGTLADVRGPAMTATGRIRP